MAAGGMQKLVVWGKLEQFSADGYFFMQMCKLIYA